jgi:hypothetical protein
MKGAFLAASVLSFSLMATESPAAVLFAFEETGGNVVGTLSGSLNLIGNAPWGQFGGVSQVVPSSGFLGSSLSPISANTDAYTATGPQGFGSGGLTRGLGFGDPFMITSLPGTRFIGVPNGYASGSALSGSLVFQEASFATLGVDPGSYVYRLEGSPDTVTLRFGDSVAPIPVPAALPLLLGALGLGFAALRRRG